MSGRSPARCRVRRRPPRTSAPRAPASCFPQLPHRPSVAARPFDLVAVPAARHLQHEVAGVAALTQEAEQLSDPGIALAERHRAAAANAILHMHAADQLAVRRDLLRRVVAARRAVPSVVVDPQQPMADAREQRGGVGRAQIGLEVKLDVRGLSSRKQRREPLDRAVARGHLPHAVRIHEREHHSLDAAVRPAREPDAQLLGEALALIVVDSYHRRLHEPVGADGARNGAVLARAALERLRSRAARERVVLAPEALVDQLDPVETGLASQHELTLPARPREGLEAAVDRRRQSALHDRQPPHAAPASRWSSSMSQSSRTAPAPPGRLSTSRAAARAFGCASPTATARPTARSAGRSFTSLPTKRVCSARAPNWSRRRASPAALSGTPCRHSRPSFRQRAATTGFSSVDMTAIGTPRSRSRAMPQPSPRCTRTDSLPDWSTRAALSVMTPSKSKISSSSGSGHATARWRRDSTHAASSTSSCVSIWSDSHGPISYNAILPPSRAPVSRSTPGRKT